jgi:23S rRNA (guanosine2251-2'-O)-methyltransferase
LKLQLLVLIRSGQLPANGDRTHAMTNSTNKRRHGPARRVPQRDADDIIFGVHAITEALANPRRQITVLKCTRNALPRLQAALAARPDLTPELVHRKDLDRLTGPDAVHQGAVMMARPLKQPNLDKIDRTGTVVLLDQVTDPHNVGAIMRSCAAFAVSALVATARHSPEGSAVVVKSASGAAEYVPFVKVTNLARAMEELREYGFTIVGLDSEADSTVEQLTVRQPLAIVLGAEGKGLRKLTRETCDHLARLDLPGHIQSLNVSNAAALTLYALRPQPK